MFDLVKRDINRFVGFGVGTVTQAIFHNIPMHYFDVVLESVKIDNQCRRTDVFRVHTDFGWYIQANDKIGGFSDCIHYFCSS